MIAYNVHIIISFYNRKAKFKTCDVTFYPSQKVVSVVKIGDFNTKTLK